MKEKEIVLTEEKDYIQSLFLANFSKSSTQDNERFFDWFIATKDGYMQSFYHQVFQSDEVDLKPEKLKAVYYFLKENLVMRADYKRGKAI